jgi:hypothetical protein
MANPAIAPSLSSLEPEIAQQGYPSSRVVQELTGGLVRIHRRVEIYEADGITPFAIDNWNARLVDGSVTVDRERDEKRSCDLLLDNTDGALKNDPNNGFYYDKILKVYWGIKYYDYDLSKWRRWETPLGVFMIDRIDEDRFPHAVKVTGRDLSKRCIVSKLSATLSFPQGSSIENMIQALGANAGIKKFALPVTGNAYSQDLVFTRGTARWEVMKQLADNIGFELYFTPDGTLTMRLYPDPTLSPIAWSFTQDFGGSLVKYSKSSTDANIYNHIIVTGSALGAEPDELGGAITTVSTSEVVFAEARNDDPSSPTNIARFGDRVKPYASEYFTSVSMAQDYANTMLRIASLEEYTMSFESLIIPWIDAGDIVEIQQPSDDKYTPSRFLLSNYTIPLGLGAMTATAKRVTVVGTKQTLEYQ